jgi:hypothetical protein
MSPLLYQLSYTATVKVRVRMIPEEGRKCLQKGRACRPIMNKIAVIQTGNPWNSWQVARKSAFGAASS